MARIFSFRRPRASAIIPDEPAQEDVGGTIPDDIRLAITRCRRRHPDQTAMLTCMQQYLIFRGDIEVHGSPEHEYASDMTGGELA